MKYCIIKCVRIPANSLHLSQREDSGVSWCDGLLPLLCVIIWPVTRRCHMYCPCCAVTRWCHMYCTCCTVTRRCHMYCPWCTVTRRATCTARVAQLRAVPHVLPVPCCAVALLPHLLSVLRSYVMLPHVLPVLRSYACSHMYCACCAVSVESIVAVEMFLWFLLGGSREQCLGLG